MLIYDFMDSILDGDWAYPSEKYEFVSWDDDIPRKNKMHVPNHQPATFDGMNLGLLGHFPNWYDGGKVWTHLKMSQTTNQILWLRQCHKPPMTGNGLDKPFMVMFEKDYMCVFVTTLLWLSTVCEMVLGQ